MRRWATAVLLALLLAPPVAAQPSAAPIPNLRNASPDQQVIGVAYCHAEWDVALADGTTRRFKEYDLALKVDTTPNGPSAGKPALTPSGRMGDRAFVVFADLDELRRLPKVACRE